MQALFGTTGLSLIAWVHVIAASAVLFVVVEIEKAVFRYAKARHEPPASKAARKAIWGWQTAVAGALTLLILGSGWLTWSRYGGGGVHYLTQKVERGSVIRAVTVGGVVNPAAMAPVIAQASGSSRRSLAAPAREWRRASSARNQPRVPISSPSIRLRPNSRQPNSARQGQGRSRPGESGLGPQRGAGKAPGHLAEGAQCVAQGLCAGAGANAAR